MSTTKPKIYQIMKKNDIKIQKIVLNKKSSYEYRIEKKIEAGIVLYGWETKSIRKKKVDITRSYVEIKDKEAYISEMNISSEKSFSVNKDLNHLEKNKRSRKLLLKKNEIYFLSSLINRKGYTAVAISLYWKNNICKIEIGIGKGKKQYDKRIKIKENEWKIRKMRTLKNKFLC